MQAVASTTASDSGTIVHQWSCHAAASGADTTLPRSASRVVSPISWSATTSSSVRASTPSISTVWAPELRSTRWTSVRLQPFATRAIWRLAIIEG